jgi:hypothetical protein
LLSWIDVQPWRINSFHPASGNLAPVQLAALSVPPLNTAALPSAKGAGKRVTSPSALGKRQRCIDGEAPASGRGSPSKLRGAFTRHQQRSARG